MGSSTRTIFASFLSLQVFVCATVLASDLGIHSKRQASSAGFNWSSIQPSTELQWTPCSGRFECARFEVPLDYANPSAGKGAIALTRIPSAFARNDTRYQGPLLLNPGGPGGSGVDTLQGNADLLKALLGDSFDYIGFDPRGVGATTPFMTPFVSEAEAGLFAITASQTLDHSADAFGTMYATYKNLGALSASRMGQLAQYVGTPAVARDMFGIVKAHGLDKLQFLGISYGTALGATFAAMFPNNVGRLVLDGVVDSIDYYQGGWLDSLVDTDDVLEFLYETCVKAGPSNCPLYERSSDKIGKRVQTLLKKLSVNPLPFFMKGQDSSLDTYGVVDYSLVKRTIFSVVYQPTTFGPELFAALSDLEKGNTTAMWQASGQGTLQNLIVQSPTCPPPSLQDVPRGSVPDISIACGDGDQVTDSIDVLRKKYQKLSQTSFFGDVWPTHMSCSGWTIRAKEHFNGSFATNTSYPILFIGNLKDPVTPLRNAKKMSGLFKNSVLLTQNAFGHTAALNPTSCAFLAMRDYFQQGILPNASTLCQPDLGSDPIGGIITRETLLEPFRFPTRSSRTLN